MVQDPEISCYCGQNSTNIFHVYQVWRGWLTLVLWAEFMWKNIGGLMICLNPAIVTPSPLDPQDKLNPMALMLKTSHCCCTSSLRYQNTHTQTPSTFTQMAFGIRTWVLLKFLSFHLPLLPLRVPIVATPYLW